MLNLLTWQFKIAFLNDQYTLEIRVVTCLDCHFVQSDLVGSGFLKAFPFK